MEIAMVTREEVFKETEKGKIDLFFNLYNNNKTKQKHKTTRKQNKTQTTTKTLQLITKGKALNGEKEFPLLLKFPFAIRRGSNIFFYLDFILH